jgi:hypothetical protein
LRRKHALPCNRGLPNPYPYFHGAASSLHSLYPLSPPRNSPYEEMYQANSKIRSSQTNSSVQPEIGHERLFASEAGQRLPTYGNKSTLQPTSSIHILSLRGADNPSSRYHPPRFRLWTQGRVVPYKTEKEMLPEPLFSMARKPPFFEPSASATNKG